MARHVGAGGEASLMRWAEGLRTAPAALNEMAERYERLARQAEEDQPMNQALRESLRAVARRCHAAAERAQGWHPTARNTMAEDFAAYEQPRDGSLHKEQKSDAQRAHEGN